jgi:hypothetical protein
VEGIDLEESRGSRLLDENVGAWSICSLGDNLTLVGYQLTIVMGGWVPDRLTARFAKNALEELMLNVEQGAREVPEHYVEDHEPILDGFGCEIPLFSAPTEDVPTG